MKKIKLSLWLAAMCALSVILQSCGNNDSTPKLQFTFDGSGETISLEGANLYLTREVDEVTGLDLRYYCISDGVYRNGDGYGNYGGSLTDFENVTYSLLIKLKYTEISPGKFPQTEQVETGMDRTSFIDLEGTNGSIFQTNGNEDHSPVVVSGGVEGNETMTVKFKGSLFHLYNNGTDWIEETGTGEFYFSGTVQDKRGL